MMVEFVHLSTLRRSFSDTGIAIHLRQTLLAQSLSFQCGSEFSWRKESDSGQVDDN